MPIQIATQRQRIDARSRDAIGRSLQAMIAAATGALAALEAGRDDDVRCLLTDAAEAMKDAQFRLANAGTRTCDGGWPST